LNHLRVKNFERFQHYKLTEEGSPKWIKLYRELLSDYEFSSLDDASKAHLILIWLLASQMKGRLPHDAKWIAAKIGATSKINLELFVSKGFLILESTLESNSESTLESNPQIPSTLISSSLLSDQDQEGESEGDWSDSPWLLKFLKEQTTFIGDRLPRLLNHDYWADVSEVVNGLTQEFVSREFAKMGVWLRDNPARAPTAKGVRRFVSGWLERAYEKQRRFGVVAKTNQIAR